MKATIRFLVAVVLALAALAIVLGLWAAGIALAQVDSPVAYLGLLIIMMGVATLCGAAWCILHVLEPERGEWFDNEEPAPDSPAGEKETEQ